MQFFHEHYENLINSFYATSFFLYPLKTGGICLLTISVMYPLPTDGIKGNQWYEVGQAGYMLASQSLLSVR